MKKLRTVKEEQSELTSTPPSQKSRFGGTTTINPEEVCGVGHKRIPTQPTLNGPQSSSAQPSIISTKLGSISQQQLSKAATMDDIDDFEKWKRQFEEEKNNPLGFEAGIGSAATTNSAASSNRLMIIGQIQEPEDDAEHPERTYFRNKAAALAEKGLPQKFSHGNTIRKHLELVRNGQKQQDDTVDKAPTEIPQDAHSSDQQMTTTDGPSEQDQRKCEDGLTEEERKRREEYNKPRGLNEDEKAQLMALFERRKQISFQALQQHQHKEKGGTSSTQTAPSMKGAKPKNITFELLGLQTFGMTANFAFQEEFLTWMRKNWLVNYDKTTKLWVFTPLEVYHHVFEQVKERFVNKQTDVIPIPPFALTLMENPPPFSDKTINKMLHRYDFSLDKLNKPRISQLPTKLYRQLYNFQKVGVQFAVDHWGRVLLGDEMGVGKTIQAIAISYLYRKDWPVLVVVPSSLRFSWRDEIYKWLEGYIPYGAVQVISKNTDNIDSNCSFTIVSYSLAQKLSELIEKMKFQIVIADEAHYLKSRESKRSRSLVPILTKIKRVLLLTGTPMLGKPNEIFNLIKILRPDVFIKFLDFGVRYCAPKEGPYGIDWSGNSNNRELHLLLEKGLMIRRLKSEVLMELPAKRRQKVTLPIDKRLTNKIQQLLSKVKKFESKLEEDINELQETLTKGEEVDQDTLERMNQKHSSLLQAYAQSGQAKAKGIFAFIETLIDSQVKFIVFAHHYVVLDQLEDQMLKSKLNYIRIDGRIDVRKRYDAVKKFQNDPRCTVAILSLTASSQGITLTAAQCVVFAEMHWTPGIMIQAEDRAHRIGQASSVTVYYLYGEDTIDSLIYPRLRLKSEVIAHVVDGKTDDETFKIQETRVVPNMKMLDRIETPPSYVPYKNFNGFYENPAYYDFKKYKQIQYMKKKAREKDEEEKRKAEFAGGDINEEEINNRIDKVVEKGFDKKYDLEHETDSEEHEYDEETDVAMPVIKSLVDYENQFNGEIAEAEYAVSKKHSEKYEKTNNAAATPSAEQASEYKQLQQMNINDFFFFKPQDLSKKKHVAEMPQSSQLTMGAFTKPKQTAVIMETQQTEASFFDPQADIKSKSDRDWQSASEVIHDSQEFPLPEAPLAPQIPDNKYLMKLLRRKLRKVNPDLFKSVISSMTSQQTNSIAGPSQHQNQMTVNSQLFNTIDGVSVVQNGANPKSQLISGVVGYNTPSQQHFAENANGADVQGYECTQGLSDAICNPDQDKLKQMMHLQPDQTMNSNVIDQKIAEAEASLINAFAEDGDFDPNAASSQDSKDSQEEGDNNDSSSIFDSESDGMSIKWKAFALLRKQFNRIDRQKNLNQERRTHHQSTMSMMLADFNAVNRLEKQQYLMYLYQMKRRRYYLNGLKMQQANQELQERLQRREAEKKRMSETGGSQSTYKEPPLTSSDNFAMPRENDHHMMPIEIQGQQQFKDSHVKSQMTNSTFLIESETMLAQDLARLQQTQKTVLQSSTNHHELAPQQNCPTDSVQEVKSVDSEERTRLLNEQFMDGMTEMPDDDEINETMSKIAATNPSKPSEAEKAEEKALSQSLLETFEMGQDDQFEDLLGDVEMEDLNTETQIDKRLARDDPVLEQTEQTEEKSKDKKPTDDARQPLPVLSKFMEGTDMWQAPTARRQLPIKSRPHIQSQQVQPQLEEMTPLPELSQKQMASQVSLTNLIGPPPSTATPQSSQASTVTKPPSTAQAFGFKFGKARPKIKSSKSRKSHRP